MKILLANKYFYIKGGAENSFFVTAELLKQHGHEIQFFSMKDPRNLPNDFESYFVSNVDYDRPGLLNKIDVAFKLLYSFESKRNIARLIKDKRPEIVHLNNIYHQISPSILHSIKQAGLPVVMSLRDYKVVCASYSMVINGKPCEACSSGRYYNCLSKKCVKGSSVKSALNVIEMYLHHNILNLYGLVDVFISPSRFLKDKVKEMGFKGKVVYLPNFVQLDPIAPQYDWKERSICYVGRLSKEKGIMTLIKAVKGLDVILKVIGDGPIRQSLETYVQDNNQTNVRFYGHLNGSALKEEICNGMFIVIPSEWYENNPRTVIESFAYGKPAIGSRMGGIPELIRHGETGLLYTSGNVEELRASIQSLLNDTEQIALLGRAARHLVEAELAPEIHYKKLMRIYQAAISGRAGDLE